MSDDRHDQWLVLMNEQQAKLATDAVQEVSRLRAKVRQLETQIAATPADLWWFQERVVLLEEQLLNAQRAKEPT